jgi:hypothetical protein
MLRTFLFAGLLFHYDCGPAEIGESCGGEGSRDSCVEGGICLTDPGLFGDGTVCRRICEGSGACRDGERCEPVDEGGALRACMPCGLLGCWPTGQPHLAD